LLASYSDAWELKDAQEKEIVSFMAKRPQTMFK
jgi:hypothetical protein